MKTSLENFAFCLLSVFILAGTLTVMGCTADGDPVSIDPVERPSSSSAKGVSSAAEENSSSSQEKSSGTPEEILASYLDLADIPESQIARGSAKFGVSAFKIGVTEVTQKLYSDIMGKMVNQPISGDDFPVAKVNWYDAVLFCNALAKKVGLDTAYVYSSVETENYLKDLSIDYSTKSVRLPTETEWEVAARGGTTTKYYWDAAEASKYANYAQTNLGVVEVGSYIPNAFGLYDMAGNVAEWVNDWYGSYPTASAQNYTGPASGTTRGVRGGSWADKATALASGERSSKAPLHSSAMLGFRVVYSSGF